MNKKQKRAVSILTAAVMAVTANLSVAAETISNPELTDIHGYMCYERDGEYWTMLDGEEYMMIDLDKLIAEGEAEECTTVLSTASGDIGCPNGWMNRSIVEINNSSPSYDSPFDLTRGDYYTPIFKIDANKSDYSMTFDINVPFPQNLLGETYDLEFHYMYMDSIDGTWYHYSKSVTFSNKSDPEKFLTGTTYQLFAGAAVKILSSSSGSKQRKYTVALTEGADAWI